jgi:hypothetical protein
VEVDGMYRKLHYTTASILMNGSLAGVSPSPVITWEFPVLAKYRFELWKVKPLFELGPSFRTAGNLNGTNPSHVGFTSGIGIGMDVRKLKIEPVLRYTRWAEDGVSVYQAKSKPDQLELLVGFSIAPESNLRPLGGRFSVGVVAGADLTDGIQAQTFSFGSVVETLHPNRAFLVGPAVDLELFNHLSVEVDAIYHPLRSTISGTFNGTMRPNFQGSTATWELPVLAKYAFPLRRVKPIVEVGPSFRLPASGLSNYGVTAGLGFETRFHLLRIAPVVRFTHWAPDSILANPRTVPNQAEALVQFSM